MKYAEKFKDPKWQKKRLQILERDGWCCQVCYNADDTLHIHHRWYEKGKDPWEYPDDCLVTLCDGCHEDETQSIRLICGNLTQAVKSKFLSGDIIELVVGFTEMPIVHVPSIQAAALNWFLSSETSMRSLVRLYFESLSKQHNANGIKDVSNNESSVSNIPG